MSHKTDEASDSDIHPGALLPDEWHTVLQSWGEPKYRAIQVFHWIHKRGAFDPSAMTDLPTTLRQRLAEMGLGPFAELLTPHKSPDGTVKAVVRFGDGAAVETVLIPAIAAPGSLAASSDADVAAAEDEEDEIGVVSPTRVTQCVSTQVGCAMRCAFCASGAGGLQRHLRADEIIAQVQLGRTLLEPEQTLRNVVLMGTGEPLHNYDATVRAVRLLTHPEGVALSHRRVTISTVGLAPEIARLGREFQGKVGLAVSLHAADDNTRARIVPLARRHPLRDLIEALRAYPLPRRRRITIEYAMIDGVNDQPHHARGLASLLRPLRVKINLIPLNRVPHCNFGPSGEDRIAAFQNILIEAGYTCLVRHRRGDDISAACGQLVTCPPA